MATDSDDEVQRYVNEQVQKHFGHLRIREPRSTGYVSSDGWRMTWTTEKDDGGWFHATLYRPTGKAARSGRKAIRREMGSDQGVAYKAVKSAKRRKRSDAKSIVEKWYAEREASYKERVAAAQSGKEARTLASSPLREPVAKGVLCDALTGDKPCNRPSGQKHGYAGDKRIVLCPQHAANVTMDRNVYAIVDGEKRRVTAEP